METIYSNCPQGYEIQIVNLGKLAINGAYYVSYTDDFFNNDDLVEMYVAFRSTTTDDLHYGIMNENSQVLLEFPEGGLLHEADLRLDGYLYCSNYQSTSENERDIYVIDTNAPADAGINSVQVDERPGSVSPNPSNGATTVSIDLGYTMLNDGQLTVVDMEGKLVHSQTIASGKRKIDLSTSHFAAGAYIYVVQTDNGYTTTGKMVIN